MNSSRAISCATLAALMAGALGASASAEAATGSRQQSRAGALASFARGDNWMAANLFEQARAGNDSQANRFDLAVAYENTGRASEAASLYRAVLRAPSAQAGPSLSNAHQSLPAPSRTMADDAQRRLARIDARHGAPAAAEFDIGASASAFVGGPSSGRVSDAAARRLDQAARSANAE